MLITKFTNIINGANIWVFQNGSGLCFSQKSMFVFFVDKFFWF